MLVTVEGMVTDVKLMQLIKAASPMLVTLAGMLTDVKLLQPAKAPLPMLVTVVGISYVVAVFPAGYETIVVLVLLNSTPSSLA